MQEKHVLYIVIITLAIVINFLLRKIDKSLKKELQTSRKYGEVLKDVIHTKEKEIYLLKAMNDSMKVTDTKGFLSQRINNAPKSFKPLDEEDVKPDNVN